MRDLVAQPTFKLMNLVLLVVGLMIGGMLSLNLHELIHIKCVYAGECFGDAEWIVKASQLHFIVIFSLISSVVMILLTLLSLLFRKKLIAGLNHLKANNSVEILSQTALLHLIFALLILLISVVVVLNV
ncbi:MAG: hypothetical protein COB51_08975 [Moraxellaceae bacterium]|nr:MAG: hypothetical protein COB51_08975 [Moraxellaceae bacterium]